MVPLRILNTSFELLGEIDNYESLQFTRRFYRPGEFEIHINISKKHTEKLQNDTILMIGADSHKAGIIQYRSVEQEETETVVVRGPQLSGIVGRRITVPDHVSGYDRISGAAETVMKYYIANHCITPADADRTIPQLLTAADQYRGITTPWQTRYENLADVLQQIAEWCDIGWEVYLDLGNSKWVFDVLPGRNLTADQDVLPPVIFSTDFENIQNQALRIDTTAYKNVGYAGGKGEEEKRLVLQVGDETGLARREVFLDCSSSEDASELTSNGAQSLSDFENMTAYEAKIIDKRSFTYGVDWDLGDIVTVMNSRWGVTMNTRIVEVKEIYEPNNRSIEVTFGSEVPTLQAKLKKIINIPIK